MRTRTTETQWTGPLTWRIVAASPIILVATPFWFMGNGLMMIAACVAGKNISYSWETDVEKEAQEKKP